MALATPHVLHTWWAIPLEVLIATTIAEYCFFALNSHHQTEDNATSLNLKKGTFTELSVNHAGQKMK